MGTPSLHGPRSQSCQAAGRGRVLMCRCPAPYTIHLTPFVSVPGTHSRHRRSAPRSPVGGQNLRNTPARRRQLTGRLPRHRIPRSLECFNRETSIPFKGDFMLHFPALSPEPGGVSGNNPSLEPHPPQTSLPRSPPSRPASVGN